MLQRSYERISAQLVNGGKAETRTVMQDGAPLHIETEVVEFSKAISYRAISRNFSKFWASNSSDLNSLDEFSFWGYLRDIVYDLSRPADLKDLRRVTDCVLTIRLTFDIDPMHLINFLRKF